MITRKIVGLSILVKLSLVAMLVVASVTDASQFQGKALGARLIFYPLGACIVALVWAIASRFKRNLKFPYRADLLVGLPFLIDTIGNWLDLFDTVTWWDDLMHFSLWFILMSAFGGLLASPSAAKWRTVLLIGGVGALVAIYWELGEYFLFVADNPAERATAYQDTVGDLILGSSGGLLAGLVEVTLLGSKHQEVGG